MRGALSRMNIKWFRGGIIPAYAGSTKGRHIRATVERDHPRVCGEHQRSTCRSVLYAGSSPRMRGALNAYG